MHAGYYITHLHLLSTYCLLKALTKVIFLRPFVKPEMDSAATAHGGLGPGGDGSLSHRHEGYSLLEPTSRCKILQIIIAGSAKAGPNTYMYSLLSTQFLESTGA